MKSEQQINTERLILEAIRRMQAEADKRKLN